MAIQYPCLENSMDRGTWQATVHVIFQDLDDQNGANLFYSAINRDEALIHATTWMIPGNPN